LGNGGEGGIQFGSVKKDHPALAPWSFRRQELLPVAGVEFQLAEGLSVVLQPLTQDSKLSE
jgi:hypothetical protein